MRRTLIALIPILAAAADAPLEVGVELQLWHPHDPLPAYAAVNRSGSVGTTSSSTGATVAPAVSAAYGLSADDRIALGLWYAHDDAHGRLASDSVTSIVPIFVLPSSTSVDEIRDHDEYTAWMVDLAYQRDEAFDGWALRPSIGLRYLDLETRQRLTVVDSGVTSHDDDRVATWAIGPRAALGVARPIGHDWSVFGDIGFALLDARVDERATAVSGSSRARVQRAASEVATTLDAAVGVAWAFARGWSADLSYGIGVWRDVLPAERYSAGGTTGGRDLSWDAIALGATWRTRR